jgi:hypothetical protein
VSVPGKPYLELEIAEVCRRWERLSKQFDEVAGLDEAPDALVHARAVPARPTPAPARKTRRGRRPIHDWPLIERLDAEFCRTHCAETRRPPSWKERRAALAKKLGMDTLHLKTLQRRLPKLRLLKERNSRSI